MGSLKVTDVPLVPSKHQAGQTGCGGGHMDATCYLILNDSRPSLPETRNKPSLSQCAQDMGAQGTEEPSVA